MTAYGAMISLKNTIDYILHSSYFSLAEPSPTIIQQSFNELEPFQKILQRLDFTRTSRSRKRVNALDGRIKDKIWEFEDKLESLLYQQIVPQFPLADGGMEELLFSIDLHFLEDDVASFIQALKDMKREYIYELNNMPQEPSSTTVGFDSGLTKSKMIGLSDQFQEIKHDLMREVHRMHLQQIAGMAGIGKTTLAKEVYEDAEIVSYFDCRTWVTVTRTMVTEGPQFDEVVQGILVQLCGDTLIQGDDRNIAGYLNGKKCLIVLDDVWEQQVIRNLLHSLSDIKDKFIRVLYTTRGISVDGTRGKDIEVRFLNEEESKDLLCHKVFGDTKLCPDQLDKAATKIAKKCEGLPLMIVIVADILSKSHNTEPEYWNDVAEERNSVFADAYNEISEVLFPSYDYLPQSHKMPFLYMGVFPPDYETPLSKLMNMLNVAGWFLVDTNQKKYLEKLVHRCLSYCGSRHLVLLKSKSVYWEGVSFHYYNFINKTCWLHASWRYTCRKEARNNKFYHVLNHLPDALEEDLKGHRRLCLQNNMLFGIKEFCISVRLICASFTRSLLFLGPYHQYPTPIDVGFKLLRELDALQLRFYTFPTTILTLVLLKYLALTCNGEIPTTISKLFNLRVLIIHPHMSIRRLIAPSYMPIQIWDMKELEHIEILGISLRVPNHVFSLEKLSTLVGVNASISTITTLTRRIPNIRKLDVRIELTPNNDHIDLLSCFAHISTLASLRILKCSIINPVIRREYIVPAPPSSLMLPRLLRKLHLSGTGFPWEYMDVIGSLKLLEVLKLRSYAFRGSNWEAPQKGSFPLLQFLLIEDSDLVCLNLPRTLTRISIKHCYKLERIHWPSIYEEEKKARAEDDRMIEIVDCNPLAMTWAKKSEPSGKYLLDVTISSSFEKEKPIITNLKRKATIVILIQQVLAHSAALIIGTSTRRIRTSPIIQEC